NRANTTAPPELPRFAMSRVGIAERAEFLQFDAVRMIALVLGCRVVPLFAVCASHSYDNPHVDTSWTSLLNRSVIFFKPKKKQHIFGLLEQLYHRGYTVSRIVLTTAPLPAPVLPQSANSVQYWQIKPVINKPMLIGRA